MTHKLRVSHSESRMNVLLASCVNVYALAFVHFEYML